MKRVNVILLVGSMWIFSMGYLTHRVVSSTSGGNLHIYQQNDSLRSVILQKDSLINDISTERDFFENQIDEMSDEMSFKESEISYWGQKYDSVKVELKKYKRK